MLHRKLVARGANGLPDKLPARHSSVRSTTDQVCQDDHTSSLCMQFACFAAWHALFRLRAATEAAEEQEADEVDCILAWKEGRRGSAKHCAGPELSRVVFESVR